MGTSQSGYQTVGEGPYSRLQTEPIPYTSYSVDRRPEDRSSSPQPRLISTQSEHGRSSPRQPSQGSPAHRIVVVADGAQPTLEDTMQMELQKLQDIPTFLPILKGTTAGISQVDHDPTQIEKMDPKHLLQLCLRYQQHLKQCAEAVAFDQNSLTSRIKEIDTEVTAIMVALLERRRKFDKHTEHIQKIADMSALLGRIQKNVDDLLPLMDRLNSILPPDDQLEPFTMKAPTKT